ncbi:MAG: hypothetical protein AB8B61_06500 [Cyclobacteriaceae bacterium]
MLDSILSSLTQQVTQKIADPSEPQFDLPQDKMNDAFALAKESILEKFTGSIQEDDDEGNEMGFASVMNLFNGKKDIGSSSLTGGIVNNFASKLITKLGVPESMAGVVASFIIPKVLGEVNNATPSSGLQQNDLTSLLGNDVVKNLIGGNTGGGIASSLIGGLFK